MQFHDFPEIHFRQRESSNFFQFINFSNGLTGILYTDRQFGNGFAPMLKVMSQSFKFGI
jgi:hypothetical protein